MDAKKLIELLSTLPPECWVGPNKVGNLIILSSVGHYLGFIDIKNECVDLDLP